MKKLKQVRKINKNNKADFINKYRRNNTQILKFKKQKIINGLKRKMIYISLIQNMNLHLISFQQMT